MAKLQGLRNKTKGTIVASKVRMATSFFKRLKGLLGTDSLDACEALFLKPCSSIHMIGMKYPIDAVFLNEELIVVAVVEKIEPGSVSKHYKEANACLELPAGTLRLCLIEEGDQFEWVEDSTENGINA